MRRAKLTIEGPGIGPPHYWVRMRARNGEVIFHSEMFEKASNAKRSRAAILRAMVDVLTDEGLVVLTDEEFKSVVAKAEDFGRFESHRNAAKAAMGVTKAEEAGR